MTAPLTLLRTSRCCYFCGTRLARGAAVQWLHKSGIRASKSHYIAERNVACCPGTYPGECEVNRRKDQDAEAAAKSQTLARTIADLLAQGDNAGALAAIAKAEGGAA